jgi:NAD(P)-dependent dehydrogenase (short-subunit alcohol dehydrogenase family)
VVATITAGGGQGQIALGDLSSDAGAAGVVSAARSAFGGIDILVNNAGGYASRGWFDTTPETWRHFYESDVISAIRLIQAFAPEMRRAGWGRIINVATGLATTPEPDLADYAAAKAALVNATVSLSKALAGSGVGACTVSPGLILTAGVETVLRQHARERGWGDDWNAVQARWFAEVLGSSRVKRLGTAAEVADLVTYLASPLADYAVGADFRIDGGLVPSMIR